MCRAYGDACIFHMMGCFLTVRRCASTVYATALCPSVRPSQTGIVPKWLNVGSRHTIAHGLKFSGAKGLGGIQSINR